MSIIAPLYRRCVTGTIKVEVYNMIKYKTGNLLTEDVHAIVNTVNCVGVMGRGIALQFKKTFPDNFKAYAAACKRNEVIPGKMFVFETRTVTNPKFIINFPTKRHWRGKSRMEDIESGLEDLVQVITEYGITSIALPPLGSGLGGLDWVDVRERIEACLAPLQNVQVIVFEPKGAPVAEKIVKNREVPKMTPGRAALIELVHSYLGGLLDPFITLLEVHKLMYFLQESGQQLRLNYTKSIYGPYAKNLRHVLNTIEGYFLSGYADGGDNPNKELKLVPGAYDDATKFLQTHNDTTRHYDRVTDLVEGFESPFGLELLSTVHWIVKKDGKAHTTQEVIDQTYRWNDRKKQFTTRQIKLALSVLAKKEWISKEPWESQL